MQCTFFLGHLNLELIRKYCPGPQATLPWRTCTKWVTMQATGWLRACRHQKLSEHPGWYRIHWAKLCQGWVLEGRGPGSHRWFSEAVTLRTPEDVIMPSCCCQHLTLFPPSTLCRPLQLSFLKVSHLNAAGFHLPPGKYRDCLLVACGHVLSLPPSAAYKHSSHLLYNT